MEWIDGIRCTDPDAIRASGISVEEFIRVGVVSGLRQLLEFGLFHGDPHPGNIFALRDGRIAYVDFGNVAAISQRNKEVLIDAVVHAVNEDYDEMAQDFIKLVCMGWTYMHMHIPSHFQTHSHVHTHTHIHPHTGFPSTRHRHSPHCTGTGKDMGRCTWSIIE